MHFLEVERTAEMKPWTGDEQPQLAVPYGQVYTSLGPFIPKRANPIGTVYARRMEYSGGHFTTARWGQLRRWSKSVLREVAEFLIGAFQPIRDAV